MSRFVHLHTHSHYSFLSALPKVDELVDAAVAKGMDAVGLTDTGNMHGAIEFYKAAEKRGVKPILGVDLYMAPKSRFDKDPVHDAKRSRIVLLAENNEGYKNLLALVSAAHIEGFMEKPRIDRELLRAHKEGLIAILPSFAGDIAKLLAAGDSDGAEAALAEYMIIMGPDNLFLEVTHHPKVAGHMDRMEKIIAIGERAKVPIVAQHDVYYLNLDDREATEVMRRIKYGAGSEGANEDEDFSFVGIEDIDRWFGHVPGAVGASGEIAARCNVSFELGKWTFPNVPLGEGFKTHGEELRAKTYEGLETRGMERTPEVEERIEYEMNIIEGKGFARYFLVVSDLLQHAKEEGILTTTRGSAAGSLVSYLTGITNVDPLAYKIPFERFLNPERPKAPDIDMDIADNRRDDMLRYVKQKYGEENVAQIGTFGTLMARAAVRDVARALRHPYGVGDRIAKLIPIGSQGFPMTIERALELEPDLKALYDEDEDAREVLDLAKRIEGCVRHVGVHAAGVVISPTPLVEWTPLQPDPKGTGKLITQYDMYSITDEYGGVGLLKFDFLGIKNLSILADAVARVKETQGLDIDIENVPLDDPKTFAMLARGETEGTFQLNGSGMTRYLKELKPTTIHDINAMVALYRPGPMESIPAYVERKHNPSLINFIDERMKAYLSESYGLLVYQDDVLLTAITLGGYSWLEADTLRKAMGKKIPAEMAAQKEKLMDGFEKHGGLTPAKSEKIWKLIEPFAAYGFGKCLVAGTRIINAKTGAPRTISELLTERTGSDVYALTTGLKLRSAKASRPTANGTKQIFRLVTRSGRVIRATGNHPFRTFDGWATLDSLIPGTRIAAPRRIPGPRIEKPLKPHEAAALGYLISEGNLCHPHGIYFYSTQDDEVQDFIRAALGFPNARITIDRSKSATSVYIGQEKQGAGNSLARWIQELGLRKKKATEKFIPADVFSADDESLALFLGKLWQGDGAVSVRNLQLMYATSSRMLAEDVQHALLRFGIVSTIHTKVFNYRGGTRDGWSIVITGHENIDRFADTIGKHLIGKKRTGIATLVLATKARTNNLGRGTPDTVPADIFSLIRSEMRAKHMAPRALAKAAGVAERLLGADARKRGITRSSLFKIGTALRSKQLIAHATSDIFWDEVRSIVPDGREMTYDLSVPGPANFIADGLIVHNSHAACYGKVAYQTSYMKANYPVEYMAAVLTADSGDTDAIATFAAECERLKIPLLPPDVNESGTDFTVVGVEDAKASAIRFGLSSIKNFGEGVAHAILDQRIKNGEYATLSDFLSRVASKSLNRKSLESLIKCGALDRFGDRNYLCEHIEALLAFHRDATQEAAQDSLFGAMAMAPTLHLPASAGTETPVNEKLAWEKELLGIYVSGNPLDAHEEKRTKDMARIGRILEDPRAGFPVSLHALICEVKTYLTKSGEKMAFVSFEDKTGSIEAVVFPKLYKEQAHAIVPGTCVHLKGKVSIRNGETTIAIDELKAL